MIVDNLDRIIPVFNEKSNKFNDEEIFIDRGDLLRNLHCHLVYTIPVSMVYSPNANVLRERYNDIQVLPMIMVRDQSGNPYSAGIAKMKEIIQKRLEYAAKDFTMDNLFEQSDNPNDIEKDPLTRLCFYSGGHVRDLMHLMQTAIQHTPTLPISINAVNRAISDLRLGYSRAINEEYWALLAKVHKSKTMPKENQYLNLLYYRFILEYVTNQHETWHDVHPVIQEAQRFKRELESVKPESVK